MIQKAFFLFLITVVFFSNISSPVFAQAVPNGPCGNPTVGYDCCNSTTGPCIVDGSYQCLALPTDTLGYKKGQLVCQEASVGKAFGKIQAPGPLAGFLAKNPTGAGAISQFLSNGVVLIYSIATIVLIFMLLWGAFDWMTSGGDKEKLAGAQRKIINAIIGILLFAVAFAIIQVLGVFTGFTFFAGQNK